MAPTVDGQSETTIGEDIQEGGQEEGILGSKGTIENLHQGTNCPLWWIVRTRPIYLEEEEKMT